MSREDIVNQRFILLLHDVKLSVQIVHHTPLIEQLPTHLLHLGNVLQQNHIQLHMSIQHAYHTLNLVIFSMRHCEVIYETLYGCFKSKENGGKIARGPKQGGKRSREQETQIGDREAEYKF